MNDIKKKKILFLITKSNWGGAQRYVFDLATGLPKNKYQAKVVLGGNGALKEKLYQKNIEIITLSSLERDINLFKDIKTFFELIDIFKKERPDIVHLNSSKIGGLGALAGKITGVKKIIFTAHGFAFNEERFIFSKAIIWLSYLFITMMSDEVISVSKNTAESNPLYSVFRKKIHTIHNGVREKMYLNKDTAQKELFGKKQSSPVIGAIGELHKSKGFKYLIGAIEKIKKDFPSIKLIILGEGEERKNLENIIEKNDLKNTVILKGFIDHGAQYIRAFDVFALSSTTEALAYVVLESGLAEVPVVATNVGGVPEILSSEDSGILIPSKNGSALADGIKKMLIEKEYANECTKKLKKIVSENFSIEKMLEKTISLYS